MEIVKQRVQHLNKYATQIPPVMMLADKTKQEPGLILGVGIIVASLFIIITLGWTILTTIITVVYPAIQSIKALETKGNDDDDKTWLTYWVVFGIFTLLDEFGGIVLSFIPFYFYVKLGFFVWMMAPQTKGAEVFYRNVLRPILIANKDKIERVIAEVKGSTVELRKAATDAVREEMSKPENLMKAANAMNSAQTFATQNLSQ